VLIALDGLKVTAANLDGLLARYAVGDKLTAHAFRRDELMMFEVTIKGDSAPQVKLASSKKTVASAKALEEWLMP